MPTGADASCSGRVGGTTAPVSVARGEGHSFVVAIASMDETCFRLRLVGPGAVVDERFAAVEGVTVTASEVESGLISALSSARVGFNFFLDPVRLPMINDDTSIIWMK